VPALSAGECRLFRAKDVQRTTEFSAQIVSPAALQSERLKSSV
jgi:hypothetical protein